MADRWKDRPEPGPGQGMLYWHVLLKDFPAVRAIAADAQERLAPFTGLHFTPIQWLHITTFVAGPADEFSVTSTEQMIESATRLLAETSAITISLSSILYHPEAIVLKVQPDNALDPVSAAVQAATRMASGSDETTERQLWSPHVTLAYSTSVQDAGPIIDALGLKLPVCEIVIDRINLVIQEGAERLWNWRSVAEVPFGKQSGSRCGRQD
jgi:2'-5' RNA ligase